jgi:hypothetical protein
VDAKAGEVVKADVVLPEPLAPGPPAPAASGDSPEPVGEFKSRYDEPVAVASPFWTARRVWGASVVGAGTVSLVVSGVFAAQAQSASNRAAELRGGSTTCTGSNCAALNNAYSSQASDATSSTVFLIGGLAAVVTGAVLFLWPTAAPSVPGAQKAFGPLVIPHGGGFQLQGEL